MNVLITSITHIDRNFDKSFIYCVINRHTRWDSAEISYWQVRTM